MRLTEIKKDFRANRSVYLMALPVLLFFILFAYIPMSGLLMAFQNYSPQLGLFHSKWLGLKNFTDFFGSYYFLRLLKNTFLLSFYDLIFAFPAPILFALLLNEVRSRHFKKAVQTISYMPFFISLVVIAGLIIDFTAPTGVVTAFLSLFGVEKSNLLGNPAFFRPLFVATNIWQNLGFQSIIYISALSAIDPEQYEAAVLDGAGRFRQTLHITLPGISGTLMMLLILRMGSMLSVGFEKVILLYSPAVYETADVISSFVYRKGLQEFNFGYSTAVGLFNSLINFALLIFANLLSRKYAEKSLF